MRPPPPLAHPSRGRRPSCSLGAGSASAHVHTNRNLVPRHGALFGAFVNRHGDPWANVVGFQRTLGYKLTIVHHYRPWSISSFKIDKAALGAPADPDDLVVAGRDDHGVGDRQRQPGRAHQAHGARDQGPPQEDLPAAGLRDGPAARVPRYIGTPREFVPAWRHVVRIFRKVGALNARFVWCGIAAHFKTGHAQAYYPGDRYVNWIAADGYNWYPAKHKWTGYRSIFSSFYHWARRHGKPLMIAETGSMEDPHASGRKAKWMTRARKWVHAHHHLKALVYFDSVSPKGYDFRVQTSGSAVHAFRRWGHGTYWNRMRR